MSELLLRVRRYWQAASTRRRALLVLSAIAAFSFMVFLGLWTRACAHDACSIQALAGYDPEQASIVYAADGRRIADYGGTKRTVIPLDEMSPAIPAAFLAAEDKRFFQHHGVDWVRFFGMIKNVLLLRSRPQGVSTITMQLAGNVFTDEIDRSRTTIRSGVIQRKLREIRVAFRIEKQYDKKKILELYLNQISLGSGYGVESASLRYFGKHAHDLNVAEAAMLAALPKAPDTYNPRKHPQAGMRRRNVVIELLRDNHQLTDEEAESWKSYPLALVSRSDYSDQGQYFVEYVRQQLLTKFTIDEINRGGLRVHTTLDLDAQRAAETAMKNQMERVESGVLAPYKHPTYADVMDKSPDERAASNTTPYLQGAALVMEAKTGNILAMVGGRDFSDSKYNRAVQALRQPGSSFKPIMYSAAVEAGVSMDDTFRDQPVSIEMPFGQPNWEPANYENRFSDSVYTVRQGLWKSLNSIAVQVGDKVKPAAVKAEAIRFGITTPIPEVPSIYIGSLSVHPIELIAGYSAFANLGPRAVPNAITLVEDRFGKKRWEPQPKTVPVLDPATAATMNNALRGVVTSGTASSAVWGAGFRIPAGGKTGTTNDNRDTWFIGFTRDLVAGVWMGFDDPLASGPIFRGADGAKVAAPAWTQMMLEIYQRRSDPGDWSGVEAGQVAVEVDKTTGYRAGPFCPADVRETRYYVRGTEPKEYCPVHLPFRPGGGGGRGGRH